MTVLEPAHWRDLEARLRPFVAKRIAVAAEVDDVLQEIYMRVLRGLPSLRDDQRLIPWTYRIARNAIVDHHRAAAKDPIPTADLATTLANEPVDSDVVDLELHGMVARFVGDLPSPYREALTLTELEGMTQRRAAEELGISFSGMKSRVQRGRRKLREALEACCEFALDGRNRVISCEQRDNANAPQNCCDDGA